MHFTGLDSPFWLALGRSVLVGVIVAAVSFGIGWPLGVRVGLTTFPVRRLLLALLALPLLLPSFLVAIGLSMLWRGLDEAFAVVWVFICLGVPLVTFAALAATLTLTRGQADAARLAGRSAVWSAGGPPASSTIASELKLAGGPPALLAADYDFVNRSRCGEGP